MKLKFAMILSVLLLSEAAHAGCLKKLSDCDPKVGKHLGGGTLSNGLKTENQAIAKVISVRYYNEENADLQAAFSGDAWKLSNHWISSGANEGRLLSPGFDANFYLEIYPDLRSAYGTNTVAAMVHFAVNGLRECRQGSATFNPQNYLARYPDLRASFGNNCAAAYTHYINSGYYEGRDAR